MSAVTAYAPGRVNLIGEHTDYNGGLVLPAALPVGLTVTADFADNDAATITADSFPDTVTRGLSENASGHWSDTALGALLEARNLGLTRGGADISINSTIPPGAGLSSSAALIVAILKAARSHAQADLSDTEIAVAARRVENDFIGVPCGIMDQMAVAVAQAGEAIALDTSTLDYRLVTLPKAHSVVVVHSGHSRLLTDGNYAARAQECDEAKAYFGTNDLCQLAEAEIRSATGLPDNVRRRALHCATEHTRVLQAVEALSHDNAAAFGALMDASHISMRDLFEMSIPPIDALVESAQELGAAGARLTGGGFGGCIVALIGNEKVSEWQSVLMQRHPQARIVATIGGQA